MKTDLFQSCGHCWVFHICWHIECITFTASSFRCWNSSTGIPSPPLVLFIVMLPNAHLTLHSRMSGSRWLITPWWLSGSWRSFLYSSSVYSCRLFLYLLLLFGPCMCVCVLSCFRHVWLFVIPWSVALQDPLSVWFSRQEYWSRLHALLQGVFPTQESNPNLLHFLNSRQILHCWATREIYTHTHTHTWLFIYLVYTETLWDKHLNDFI